MNCGERDKDVYTTAFYMMGYSSMVFVRSYGSPLRQGSVFNRTAVVLEPT